MVKLSIQSDLISGLKLEIAVIIYLEALIDGVVLPFLIALSLMLLLIISEVPLRSCHDAKY